MKINITICFLLILLGCASYEAPPPFENSHQRFIEKTINQLNIAQSLSEIIDTSQKIIILPLDRGDQFSKPIISMLEDQIILSLFEYGFTILERNNTAIEYLIKEQNDNFYLTFIKPGGNLIENNINNNIVNPSIKFEKTHLSSADIVITYRILEMGIIYLDYPDDKEFNKREALVNLHIRIQDASTGEILHTTNLDSKSSDITKKKFEKYLSSFHYTFFPYEYPIQEK